MRCNDILTELEVVMSSLEAFVLMILKLTRDILCNLFKNRFIIWLLVGNKFIKVILLF